MIDGRRSLCRFGPEKGSLVISELLSCWCIGGSSTEDLGLLSLSVSESDSCSQCLCQYAALPIGSVSSDEWSLENTHAFAIPI